MRFIEFIDPLEDYPWPDKMNYDDAVNALQRQSAKGRATFCFRFVQSLNRKDLSSLRRYVQQRYPENPESLNKVTHL